MKIYYSLPSLGLFLLLAGCTTSSQVQEMIDASRLDYSNQLKSHQSSIEVLKKSAMTGLETGRENTERLAKIQVQLKEIQKQIEIISRDAEASKVMSAANTVKVASLDRSLNDLQETAEQTISRLAEIDKLYESVMMRHYEMIIQSANEAMGTLKKVGVSGGTNAVPVKIDAPIEIVAPATTVNTNATDK